MKGTRTNNDREGNVKKITESRSSFPSYLELMNKIKFRMKSERKPEIQMNTIMIVENRVKKYPSNRQT